MQTNDDKNGPNDDHLFYQLLLAEKSRNVITFESIKMKADK